MSPEPLSPPGAAAAVPERPASESASAAAADAGGEVAYLAALSSLAGMGPARLERLLARWAPKEAWRALASGRLAEAAAAARVGEKVARRWISDAARADPAEIYLRHTRAGVTLRRRGTAAYPERLIGDPEPPAVLFSQGPVELLERPTVTIVGTRRCTRYGADVAFDLGKAAAANGVTVISGLAIGIDAAAHAGALAADGAPPVGVVGSGLDRIYPRENAVLWKIVAQRGLLLAEAPLGAPPERWRFPARNRIMAALSDACVVVESHEDGGAIGTATEAAQRDRTVAAVPGPIRSPASAGSNRLIAEGAGVLCDVEDLLVLLDISRTKLPSPTAAAEADGDAPVDDAPVDDAPVEDAPVDDATARAILGAFDWMPATMEMLAARTGLELGELAWHLEGLSASGHLARRGLWYERRGGATAPTGSRG
ncbi:MAG: DNA-protecting protein DprA [Acidimicrobiia bacterium]|nr:DNA-protecting protein DprA [Acidimicrobiia bacterium]MYJ12777.1 DNA-protecting protein DprA [Acidimicrobiia bacterium]